MNLLDLLAMGFNISQEINEFHKKTIENDPIYEFKRMYEYWAKSNEFRKNFYAWDFNVTPYHQMAVTIAEQMPRLFQMIDHLRQDNAYLKKQYDDLIESLDKGENT